MSYFDAHNHLHDQRFNVARKQIIADIQSLGIKGMVVNGTGENDWKEVLALAQAYHWIIPAFGYHPWFLDQASTDWKATLEELLDSFPSSIGEIGLDRSKRGTDFERQKSFFTLQLEVAAERNLPVSIHCIDAWGALIESLAASKLPQRGFLLHSYSGSAELVPALVKKGAFFSFPGYYLNPAKESNRQIFRKIPLERILVETDAPNQNLPSSIEQFKLHDSDNKAINHPANIVATYREFASVLDIELETLKLQSEKNYSALFGDLIRA